MLKRKHLFIYVLTLAFILVSWCGSAGAMPPLPDCLADCVQFSPNGRFVAAISRRDSFPPSPTNGARVWLVENGSIYCDLPWAGGSWLAFSPDSQSIAFIGDRGQIEIRNLLTNELRWALRNQIHVEQFWFSPDGRSFITTSCPPKGAIYHSAADKYNDFEIWTLSEKPTKSSQRIESRFFEVSYPPSGPIIRALSPEEQAQDRKICAPIPAKESYPIFANSKDGQWQAFTTYGLKQVQIWNRSSCELKTTLEGEANQLWFSPSGRLLIGTTGRQIFVWDLATGSRQDLAWKATYPIRGPNSDQCAISTDETSIAAASGFSPYYSNLDRPVVTIYNLRTGQSVASAR